MAPPKRYSSRLDTRISPTQRAAIDALAGAADVPPSWLVRELLGRGLEHLGDPASVRDAFDDYIAARDHLDDQAEEHHIEILDRARRAS